MTAVRACPERFAATNALVPVPRACWPMGELQGDLTISIRQPPADTKLHNMFGENISSNYKFILFSSMSVSS